MAKIIIKILGAWGLITSIVVAVLNLGNPTGRAVLGMSWGLIIFWIVVIGGLSWKYKDRIKTLVGRVPGNWGVKFVAFCTLMALIEEAVTTSMTNAAPIFGVKIGQAYITASANYLDVVLHHSVIVFIPMFLCWALLLHRYDFKPEWVFLIFGFTGTVAEASFAGTGISGLLAVGFWTFVYGLMVYLPVYCLPTRPSLHKPPAWLFVAAIFLPYLFVPLTAAPLKLLEPSHPAIHFPPIQ